MTEASSVGDASPRWSIRSTAERNGLRLGAFAAAIEMFHNIENSIENYQEHFRFVKPHEI